MYVICLFVISSLYSMFVEEHHERRQKLDGNLKFTLSVIIIVRTLDTKYAFLQPRPEFWLVKILN